MKSIKLIKNSIAAFSLGLLIFINISPASMAQDFNENKPQFSGAAYIDLFYGYDFNKPEGKERLPYIYHYNRHNEFNLNHGLIAVNMKHSRYRANLALQAGTYVIDNYSSEPDILKYVFDANVGLSLNKSGKVWLDVGIFGNSWIGIESTLGYSNWAASRSILSENVPYYMAGIKMSYNPSERWLISGLIVNGWQRIKRVEGSSLPGFGTQVSYEVDDQLTVNWSTFVGTDDPDSSRRIRFFNNFYVIWNIQNGWGLTLGADYGIQQKHKNTSEMNNWYGLVALIRRAWTDKWATTLRYEYYHDENKVIVDTPSDNGYRSSGISANIDYKAWDMILCRIEGRWFLSPDEIYPFNGQNIQDNFFLLGTISVELSR